MKLPRHKREDLSSATITQALGLIVGFSTVFALTAYAADPGWWSTPGIGYAKAVMPPEVFTNEDGGVTTNYARNDNAVVTDGQLKQFTVRAVDELNYRLPGGAGTNLNNLVQGWQIDYYANRYWDPNYPSPENAAMSLGQLKYIANLVYSQLTNAGYIGLQPAWLHPNTNTDNVLATIGQLKTVFNFDLTTAPGAVSGLTVSTNSDGVVGLSWTLPGANTATGVTILQSTDGGATWSSVATLSPTNSAYASTNLTAGATYQVTTSNGNGSSGAAYTGSALTQVPATPAGLAQSTDSSGYMDLTWIASPGATSYLLERESLATGIWSTLPTPSGTAYQDKTYGPGGYHYRVSAVNNVGTSASSNEIPTSRYAVIELDAGVTNGPCTPIAFNNQGSVVLATIPDDYWDPVYYYFWSGGTVTSIPLQVGGMNQSNVVSGIANLAGDGLAIDVSTSAPTTPYYANEVATWTPTISTNTGQVVSSFLTSYPQAPLAPYAPTTNLGYVGPGAGPLYGGYDYDDVYYDVQSVLPADYPPAYGQGFFDNFGLVTDYPTAPPIIDDQGNVYADAEDDTFLTWLVPPNDGDTGDPLRSSIGWSSVAFFQYSPSAATQIGDLVTQSNDNGVVNVTGEGGNVVIGQKDAGFSYFYYDGAMHDLTTSIPIAVNSLGEVLTQPLGVINQVPNSAPIDLSKMQATDWIVSWNKNHQIIGSDYYCDSTSRSMLDDLLAPQSGWSGVSATSINDGGAIAATANKLLYNSDGTPLLDSNGNQQTEPHAVILVPFEIDHEITLGSGNYDQISTAPIFQPNDGIGRGAPATTDTPGVSLIATHDSNGVITGLSGTITTSIGSFTGSLSPSGGNPALFSDANNAVGVTVGSGVTLSDSMVDTLPVTINSVSLGLSSVSFTLVETASSSSIFLMPIYSCTFAPNSQSSTATLNLVTLTSAGDENPGYSLQSYTLNQISSNVFSDTVSGLTVSISSSSSSGGIGIDNIVLSGSYIPSQGIPLTLKETANSTSMFYYGPNTIPGTNLTPDDPSVTGDGTFYIRLKGVASGSQQLPLSSDVDSITTTFSPDPNDPTSLRSDLLLLVPQGSNISLGSILKVLHIPAPTLTSNWAPKINLSMPSPGGGSAPILPITAKPGLYVGIGITPNDPQLAVNPVAVVHYPNHFNIVCAEFNSGSFKLAADQDGHGCMTIARMSAAVPAHTAWYSFQHGVSDANGKFEGIQTFDLKEVKPSDIQNWIKNQKYSFVFINGCSSADGGPGSVLMSRSWNCNAYLGNSNTIAPLRCMKIGEEFAAGPLGQLTKDSTLNQFISQCNDAHPASNDPIAADFGLLSAMSGGSTPISKLGF